MGKCWRRGDFGFCYEMMTTSFRGWIDLSVRAKFRLRGPDRVRYLNGQVTNNVARLQPGQVCQALVCTHKGRLEGELFVRAEADVLLMDAPGELREALFARLSKYIIADDCELEDVTDDFRLWHEVAPDVLPTGEAVNRYGVLGRDVWVPAGEEREKPVDFVSPEVLEAWRVRLGIPRWGAELTPEVFPQEARMEERAVDFYKGCYVGQEVVSRLRSVGHVNRLLQGLETLEEEAPGGTSLPKAGTPLITPEGAAAGVLTSVVRESGDGGRLLALGYVKRMLLQPGASFHTGGGDVPVRRWRIRELVCA